MSNAPTTASPITAPVWVRTAKGVQTWQSPIGPIVVFKEGAYWYAETPTYKVVRRPGGYRSRRPVHYSGLTTATQAKQQAYSMVRQEVERAAKAHTATPAFPFVVGQRISCSFGVATVVKADRPGWVEVIWDNGTDATGEEFDPSEFVPA
jgi:hypothetical protein